MAYIEKHWPEDYYVGQFILMHMCNNSNFSFNYNRAKEFKYNNTYFLIMDFLSRVANRHTTTPTPLPFSTVDTITSYRCAVNDLISKNAPVALFC
jgi:hypothetical protein